MGVFILTIVIIMTIIIDAGVFEMKNRVFYTITSIILLCCGGLLYIIFRENTYIAEIFSVLPAINVLQKSASNIKLEFFKYYLQDFLWAVSLNLALFIVIEPTFKQGVICSVITFLFGTLWEILQYLEIISGTSDICDILMYFMATIFAILIFIKKEKLK